MRIAIFGAGGVGGYFGGRLAAGGTDVALVARGRHLRALRDRGLTIESPLGDLRLADVEATDDPAEIEPVHVVLVTVKTWQLEDAVPGIRRLLGDDTWVVPLLNGVEAADRLSDAVGSERVVGGTCKIISRLGEPGTIVHVGATPWIAVGELDGEPRDRTERLREALVAAGVEAVVSNDIHGELWKKFLFVVSVGGVGAVTRAPIGVTRDLPETRAMLEACMREIEVLARARRIDLPERIVPDSMSFVDSLPAEGTASLQRDIADGRPSELEAWTGAVVRLGHDAGVPTPTHEFIYSSLRPAELAARDEL